MDALRAEVVALRPEPGDVTAISVSPDSFPAARYGFADRYRHALTALRALEVLREVPPLDPRADPSGDGFVGQADLDTVLAGWGQGILP